MTLSFFTFTNRVSCILTLSSFKAFLCHLTLVFYLLVVS